MCAWPHRQDLVGLVILIPLHLQNQIKWPYVFYDFFSFFLKLTLYIVIFIFSELLPVNFTLNRSKHRADNCTIRVKVQNYMFLSFFFQFGGICWRKNMQQAHIACKSLMLIRLLCAEIDGGQLMLWFCVQWVSDGSPTHSSTPVKIDGALQFVPKNTNPKEFKQIQQQVSTNIIPDYIRHITMPLFSLSLFLSPSIHVSSRELKIKYVLVSLID